MSSTISRPLTALLVVSVALSLEAGTAATAKRDRHAASATHRVRSAQHWHYPPYVVRRQPMSDYDYNHPDATAGGPGYVFIPGRGILNESCNMPTSTCTNEYRDVQ
jgi:hypothetical protein